jgi:uncharacterized protein YkwD
MLNFVALLVVLGLGVTTAIFQADTARRDPKGHASTDLAIRAYELSDQVRSKELIRSLQIHLGRPYTWSADNSLNAASWSILRYTEGLSSARVDGVVPEAMEGAVVTDPLVIPIELESRNETEAIRRLAKVLREDFSNLHFNRLGLAAEPRRGTYRLTCLLSLRRLEVLSSIPQITDAGFFVFNARVLQPARSAEILVLQPNGKVQSKNVEIRKGMVRAHIPLEGQGKHKIEVILKDDPRRPQPPAALFAIHVGEGRQKISPVETPRFRLLPFGKVRHATKRFSRSVRTWTDQLRQQNGLHLLIPDSRLNSLAQKHAEELATRRTLSHLDERGRNPRERIEGIGYRVQSSGENVAAGLTIEAIKSSLENSPSHRQGMLRGDVRDIGVGVAERDGVLFVVQLFASE